MIRVILDQGLPPEAAVILRDRGVPANHTSEIELAMSSDAAILQYAASEAACVATLDLDFPRILAIGGLRTPSVILLRLTGLKAEATANLLEALVRSKQSELEAGAIVTMDESGLRTRMLPIV